MLQYLKWDVFPLEHPTRATQEQSSFLKHPFSTLHLAASSVLLISTVPFKLVDILNIAFMYPFDFTVEKSSLSKKHLCLC
jgi:hypothetical protein